MKIRIISAAAAIAVLAAVICLGREAVGIAVFIIALAGINEFYGALHKGGYKPVWTAGYLSCLPLLYLAFADGKTDIMHSFDPSSLAALVILLFIFLLFVALFGVIIFTVGRYSPIDISITLFGIFYVVFLFSFVTLTRNLEKGYLYIWLILIGACATDTFAYFTGVSIGRTKILPVISPKKSLEGSIGGIIGCIAVMAVFGLYADLYFGFGIPLYHFIILGGICGVVSQLGDWSASAVKRFANIKDFGCIMPGHGGVLDRIDSILFTAPAVYFYINLFL